MGRRLDPGAPPQLSEERANMKECKGCDGGVSMNSPLESYGYCGYACMAKHKPEAFGGSPDDLIPEPESPDAFHKRKMQELEDLCND